MNSVNSISKCN